MIAEPSRVFTPVHPGRRADPFPMEFPMTSPSLSRPTQPSPDLSRRTLLARLLAAGPVAFVLAACTGRTSPATPAALSSGDGSAAPGADASAGSASDAQATSASAAAAPTEPAVASGAPLSPTPACGDDDDPTPAQTEGPYFTADSPERADLREAGMAGTTLVVAGRVLHTDCRPVAAAILDFWHCDDGGAYDNVGYRLRGHHFSDADGRWQLTTIVPGSYPGRTRHIHVRVQAPDGPLLTTQLYFPDEPGNASDGIYDEALVMAMADGADGSRTGTFDFVVAT